MAETGSTSPTEKQPPQDQVQPPPEETQPKQEAEVAREESAAPRPQRPPQHPVPPAGAHPPRPGPPSGWPAPPPAWLGHPPGRMPLPPMAPWPVAPQPSARKRRWPGPSAAAASQVAVVATVCAAAVAAASLPLDRSGLGWLIAAVAGTAALTAAARSGSRSDATGAPKREPAGGLTRWVWAAATLALLGVGTLRAAGWLFVLCLLTAVVTGCLALLNGRSVAALLASLVLPGIAAIRSLPWAARGLSHLGRRSGRSPVRILATGGVSLVLLIVFGALFASADVAFAELLGWLMPEISLSAVFRIVILFPLLTLGLTGGAYLVTAPPDLAGLEAPEARRVHRLEWAVPLALLDLLFAAFVLVQVTVLFGGAAHVLGESGPTFAQYARQGFWQLLLVTALALLVLGAAARWAPRATRGDRVLIRILLGALALLTLVIVASALYRMHVYQEAYGFTRLRVFVSAFELWLGLVFLLVLCAGLRLRAAWLPRLVVGSAVACLLALAALNPDRFIAERNIDRYTATGRIDVFYLSLLSSDAVPALDRLPDPLRDCALRGIAERLADDPDDWRSWNVARTQARELIAADQPAQVGFDDCERAVTSGVR